METPNPVKFRQTCGGTELSETLILGFTDSPAYHLFIPFRKFSLDVSRRSVANPDLRHFKRCTILITYE